MQTQSTQQALWLALHQQVESYEGWALMIKLAAFALCTLAMLYHQTWVAMAILPLLWLLDAIYKTFQGRLEKELLKIEQADANATPQLYSDWQQNRPSALGLISEYLRAALRPTVAFPYPLLIAAVLTQYFH